MSKLAAQSRYFCVAVVLTCLGCQTPQVSQTDKPGPENPDFVVTLLGTGNPVPSPRRYGVSTLVEVGGKKLLFDAGRGTAIRMAQLRQDRLIAGIDHVFLTHLHSDHIMGLADLWHTGWLRGRKYPLGVSGPEGTIELTQHLRGAFEHDLQFRLNSPPPGRTPEGLAFSASEIAAGPVYSEDGVVVTAYEADHGWIHPALGFRVDYDGRSVVISGDTRFSENLIKHSQGVDLLIHEVIMANYNNPNVGRIYGIPEIATLHVKKLDERLSSAHTTPRDAGTVFARVQPKLAVYSHLILPGFDPTSDDGEAAVLSETRATYAGPVVIGEDLMQISIDEEVRVLSCGLKSGPCGAQSSP